jgi:hypothetical protein
MISEEVQTFHQTSFGSEAREEGPRLLYSRQSHLLNHQLLNEEVVGS